MKRIVTRVYLKNPINRKTRRFVLTDGPTPRKNEVCTLEGVDWLVTKVEETEIFAEFSTSAGSLKQVWP